MIYQMKGPQRMILISDSTITHGMPDGRYAYEGYDIVVKDGVSRTVDGALDGGGAYLDQAIRNLISIGIEPADAFCMATETPARRMGFDSLGWIRVGQKAHLVGWSDDWTPICCIMDNQICK